MYAVSVIDRFNVYYPSIKYDFVRQGSLNTLCLCLTLLQDDKVLLHYTFL